jgi:hypothetical protein
LLGTTCALAVPGLAQKSRQLTASVSLESTERASRGLENTAGR